VKLLLLGAPQLGGDCWHDDIHTEAQSIGWSVDYLQIKGAPVGDVVRQAKGADLVLWARTHRHDPAGDAAAMLRRIEDAGTPTVGLHLDLYWGIPAREAQIGVHPWWTAQHIYTADGGSRNWGGRRVNHRWCPPAFGTRFLGRVAPAGRYRYVFTGSNIRGIHGDHRAGLLRWARARWRGQFGHYGAELPKIYRTDLSRVYSYAHCVMGDSAPAPRYWSNRVVHAMGRGAVLAHPHTDGLAEQGFTDDVMVLYRRHDFTDLGRRLVAMTPSQRWDMRERAVDLVRSRHLWRHRLEQMAREVLG
jgi:hypothetical protein